MMVGYSAPPSASDSMLKNDMTILVFELLLLKCKLIIE